MDDWWADDDIGDRKGWWQPVSREGRKGGDVLMG